MRSRKQSRWRGQSGQALLETGLMIIVIFMVVFFVFEMGWLMYTYSVLADAANEGVRYAIVHSGGDPAGTELKVRTFATTSMHNTSAMSVFVTAPDGNYTPPNHVRVTVTYIYIPFLPKFITARTMHAYAEGRMVAQ